MAVDEHRHADAPRSDQTGPDFEVIHEGGFSENDTLAEKLVDASAQSIAAAKRLTEPERLDALQWLLADEPEDMSAYEEVLELNIGSESVKRIVQWVIKPLDGDTFNALRKRAQGNRKSRRADAEIDMTQFNLMMVACATVSPDLSFVADRKEIGSADPLSGPMQIIANRFAHKPGLVDQIGGRVMAISGYDEDDVVRTDDDMKIVRAAGNSSA